MLAQVGGQGRLAVGAILGAAIAALFLLGISTGQDGPVGNAQNPFPLAMNDGPQTTGPAAAPAVATSTAVLSATVVSATTTTTTSTTISVASTTDSVVTTSAPPPTHPTAPPPTTAPTTVHSSKPKPTRTRNPCWFIFC